MLKLTLNEFCYWLQGAIEIGGLTEISEETADKILLRLQCVNEPHPFPLFVAAHFSAFPPQQAFSLVSARLQEVFRHDIDPSYEGDQTFLNDVHDGAGHDQP